LSRIKARQALDIWIWLDQLKKYNDIRRQNNITVLWKPYFAAHVFASRHRVIPFRKISHCWHIEVQHVFTALRCSISPHHYQRRTHEINRTKYAGIIFSFKFEQGSPYRFTYIGHVH
jgi:hypothetical protein